MKLVSLILFSIFLASTVHAGPEVFDGTWSGQGVYILKGDLTQCSSFEMKFSATENTFEFTSGSRVCQKHSEKFYTVTMDLRDGKLLIGDQVVGSYDGDHLQAGFRAPDGDSFRNWRMTMHRQGDHIMYEESRTMEGETTPMISFAGLLIKNAK